MSQFLLSAYYLLGGAYTMQLDQHVRMDLIYGPAVGRASARSPTRSRSCSSSSTLPCLFGGGLSSTNYAIVYGQKNYTAWSPPLVADQVDDDDRRSS